MTGPGELLGMNSRTFVGVARLWFIRTTLFRAVVEDARK
jgi:hypothetical protein